MSDECFLFLEAECLFFDEGAVVEVVYLHGLAHFVHRLAGFFPSYFTAFAEYLIDGGYVFLVLCSALTDGFEHFLEHAHEKR